MKLVFISSIILALLALPAKAQIVNDTTDLFTVSDFNDYRCVFFGKIDSVEIRISRAYRNNTPILDLYTGNIHVDTIIFDNASLSFWPGKRIFISGVRNESDLKRSHVTVDISKPELEYFESGFDHVFNVLEDYAFSGNFQPSNYPLGVADFIPTLFVKNIVTGKSEELVAFEKNPETGNGIVQVLVNQKGNLLIELGQCYLPLSTCENFTYYKYNLEAKELVELPDLHLEQSYFSKTDETGNNIYYEKTEGYSYELIPILNDQFSVIDSVLKTKKNYNMVGWRIKNEKLHSYYFQSALDKGKYRTGNKRIKVIIPYKPSIPLEVALRDIYENKELKKSTIQTFGLYEWLISKNFIFAKHNYAFDSHFYQAYFNLFDFYNTEEKRASRTKDVNNKLTETDLKNLNLINKAIEKLK